MEATNGRKRAEILPEKLHPLLAERVANLRCESGYPAFNRDGTIDPTPRPFPHPDQPLRHAEVKAVNELLLKRGPDVNLSAFGEMRIDNFAPFVEDEVKSRPSCANCAALLGGTPSNAGRFTAFPPGPDNFVPE